MHHPLFGHSYAVLVVPILLSTIAFNLLNRKKTSVRRVAEDADTGKSGSSTGPTETNPGPSSSSTADSDGSSSSTALEEINNSASDPLTRPFENRYEVFLSFRGPDTRKGFTDHLYTRLVDAGVRVLRNDDELCQGEEICQDILGAINYAKILIPIISVNYGSSKRCLDELVQIVECKNNNTGHIVLPIFYKVEPTHVRRQIRRFGDAFRTSARCYDPATLKKWKEALVEVSSMKGWEAKGFEGELVKSVVQKVLRELKKKYELDISDNLVGIHSHVGRVMEFVDENPSATIFVGIHGMGGIGKTTLAKAIYNMLFNQFECRSFIADISEYTRQNGLEYLQNKLIFDIMKLKGQVHNKDEGIGLLSSKFKHKRVLILLDGVDDDDQLKALVGNHNWFSSGSRILITTRDKGILDNVGVDYYYEHKELDKDQSSILFNRHAFRRDAAPRELEGATYDVVSATGGLPLSLEVVGSFLRGKPLATWIGAINKLRKIPHDKVQDKLMISFNALDNGQKEIFLDIACFFSGTDRRIASYMWDACGFSPEEGIEVLQLMSLIKVGDNNELQMHGQLRDLGREIIRQENPYKLEYRSRFWNFEDVLDMLERKEGTKNIKAISLELSRGIAGHGGDIHTDEQFKNLTSLRILHASGAHFIGDFENSMTELRWLRWRYCPSSFEANKFHLKKLAVLDLSRSKILDQWRGWSFIMMAKKLKFLDLTYCRYLKGTSFLSAFTNLEVLILRDCQEVEQIDSSIGDMKSLIILDLTKCRRLKKLPIEVGKLKALEQLLLEDNDKISILPDIGALQNLEILNISGSGIKEFPSGIERLRKLQVLDASRCAVLGGEMPKSIRDLSSLQRLDFQDCQKLQWLPELPFGLIYLSVTCQSRRLPSLSLLNHLKELQILDCRFLECIFELPSTTLELRECSKLTDAQALELPRTLNPPLKLEILKMRGCEFMETLDVSLLNHLKTLSVECCKNILEIRGLGKLKDLESLTITKCTSIERLNLLNIKGLKVLHAEGCENLVEIEGLGRLELLQDLNISWCALIDRLDLTKSKGLMILNAKYCKKLVEIQGLESLEFLKELNISRCALIERLDLSKSERLKILEAKDCEKLVEIQGLNKLKLLEELDISQWTSIKRLDLQESKKLKILHVTNCKNLVKIQDLDKLEFLEKLKISGCASIERLDLPKSKDLKLLHARECRNLVEIQGLDKLKSLEELDVSGCDSIERLDLSKSEHLKTFHNSDCKKLGKVQGLNRLEFSKGYFF